MGQGQGHRVLQTCACVCLLGGVVRVCVCCVCGRVHAYAGVHGVCVSVSSELVASWGASDEACVCKHEDGYSRPRRDTRLTPAARAL